jgi:hypothetical protein
MRVLYLMQLGANILNVTQLSVIYFGKMLVEIVCMVQLGANILIVVQLGAICYRLRTATSLVDPYSTFPRPLHLSRWTPFGQRFGRLILTSKCYLLLVRYIVMGVGPLVSICLWYRLVQFLDNGR